MSDSIQQSLRNLSLQGSGAGRSYDRSQQPFTTPPRQSSSSGTGSGSFQSPSPSRALQQGDVLPPQPYFGAASDASAAARFERFFPTSPGGAGAQHSSLGPAGVGGASKSAFGSFGRAPGSIGSSSIGSGHFGSSSGMRKTSNRAAIPAQWNAQETALNPPPSSTSPPKPSFHPADLSPAPPLDDDIIPTAIVVKNIPFSVKREQLLQIIEDLACPMPYAFNYHCDQGVFRGLAFANFKDPEEADQVVAALNGFDVSGRKLRVEYKKVLQAGEKERIEKEKAIKRMHSMQLEKERERALRQQDEYASNAYLMPGYPGQFATPELYVAPSQALSYDAPAAGLRGEGGSLSKGNVNPQLDGASTYGGAGVKQREELDLNDASTLEIYSRVLLFRDDRMRDELSFSRSLTPSERRIVHLVAQKLGLYHYSAGEGEERCVVVSKNEVPAHTRSSRSQTSSIGRSQRGPLSDMLTPASAAATTGRTGLKLKKSAPDMLYEAKDDGSAPAPSSSYGGAGYSNPATGSLAARKSNSNLGEGYSATMGRRPHPGGVGGAAGLQSLFASPFDVPPVPSLPGAGEYTSSPQYSNLLRQPRGPPTPGGSSDARNFAVRSRVNTATRPSTGTSSPTPSVSSMYLHDNSPTKPRYTVPTLTDSDLTTHSPLEI